MAARAAFPEPHAPRCACAAARALRAVVSAAVLAVLLGACSQFGLPHAPPELWYPPHAEGRLFLVYDPETVQGFGHTGVIVVQADGDGYLRYDVQAASEAVWERRVAAGEAGWLEGLWARIEAIMGWTTELVHRGVGPTPAALMGPGELLVPIRDLDVAAVREAAEARWRQAREPESPTAPDYSWAFNNSQDFVRGVLRAGGPIPERYFPKHLAEAYLRRLPRTDAGP